MTAHADLDRQLAWWFEERATPFAPDGLLGRSVERVGSTRQRPGWLVRDRGRSPRAAGRRAMPPALTGRLVAIALAAAFVAIGAGLFLKLSPALIAGPSSSPSSPPAPSASASPSAAPSETPSPTPAPKQGDLIAYIRITDKVGARCYDPNPTCPIGRLWLVGSDGRGAHELLPDGSDNQASPVWSPDGTRLLYVEYGDGGKVHLTDASGSEPQLVDTGCVAPCAEEGDFAFSSDGTHLVFVRTSLDSAGYLGPSAIATMDLASGQVSELTSTAPTGGSQPEWSPDGTQIVFSRSWGKGKSAVFVVDADGQNLHRISPQKPQAGSPGWSPDGSRIVFTSYDPPVAGVEGDHHQDIYTIRPDGTDLRQLTTDGISNRATWTPNGRILFSRGIGFVPDGGEPGFWTMDADGSNAARLMPSVLTGSEWAASLPVWQPAGGPAIVAPPWNPSPATPAGPPPPTPAPTPTPPLASGFSWTGSIPVADGDHAGDTATLLADGRVLVTRDCDTTAELYDPATGTFSPTGLLTATRGSKTATLMRDGRVLLSGGYDCGASDSVIWASAELYDPDTGTFKPTGSMSVARSSHTATLLADGRVLIAGGQTNRNAAGFRSVTLASYRLADTASNVLASAEVYDPATGTFSRTGSMSVFRDRFTATLLQNGRVLIVGGGGEGYASRTEVELYDPATGTFTRTGSLKSGRWLHTATLLADGRVLIAGGRSPNDATYRTAEVYDPSSGRFSATGSMKTGRQQHTATLLKDGRVLIAGGGEQKDGGSPGQTLTSTELYDPGAGTFTPIGSMGDLRSSHTATLLRDGRVLIAGGSYSDDDGSGAVTSAVLYQP